MKQMLSRPMTMAATLCVMIFPACNENPMPGYSRFENIGAEKLVHGRYITFSPLEEDSIHRPDGEFNFVLAVRYSSLSKSATADFLLEETSLENNLADSIRLSFRLFDDYGKPTGKGIYGIHELRDTFHCSKPLPYGYSLSVSLPPDCNASDGIKSIGLTIYPK